MRSPLLCFCHAFLLVFTATITHAQTKKIDSLLQILKTSRSDTNRVNVYDKLFLIYEFTDTAKAVFYLEAQTKLAKKIHYKKGLALSYVNRGFLADDKGQYQKAITEYNKALKVYRDIKFKPGIADALDYIGLAFYNMSDFSKALAFQFKSLAIRMQINDNRAISSSYNNIGNTYTQLGKYDKALKYHFDDLRLAEKTKNESSIAYAYWGIANIYYFQQKYDDALMYYEKCLVIVTKLGDAYAISSVSDNIGVICITKKQFSKALSTYSKSLALNLKTGNKNQLATTYKNIGTCYYSQYIASPGKEAQKLLSLANENYLQSLILNKEIGDKQGIATSYHDLGAIMLERRDLVSSRGYFESSLEISLQIKDLKHIKDNYEALSKLDSLSGNFKAAFLHYQKFLTYKDSLNSAEVLKQTYKTKLTYDFEKKEAVINIERKKELEMQKSISIEKDRKQFYIIAAVGIGLSCIVAFSLFIMASLRKTRKQKSVIEEQKVQVEKQKLLVEEKQKELVDSIYYARRIQRALLPSEKYISKSIGKDI